MDEVMSLLAELAQLDVSLVAENGLLKISAAKGVLTGDLRRRLAESKDQIVRRLEERIEEESASRGPARIVPDSASDHLPFPLSDLQLGFYVANDPYMEFTSGRTSTWSSITPISTSRRTRRPGTRPWSATGARCAS